MEKLTLIERNRRFLTVPRRHLADVVDAFIEGAAQAGTTLVREGCSNGAVYLLVEGIVELTRAGRHLGFVHGDDYFGGEGGAGGPAKVSAVALTRVRFLVAAPGLYREMVERGWSAAGARPAPPPSPDRPGPALSLLFDQSLTGS